MSRKPFKGHEYEHYSKVGSALPFNPFVEPRSEILKALEDSTDPLSWTKLKTRAGISQGTLSKYLKPLIEEGTISTTIDDSRRPPSTLYSLSETGMKEVKKIRAIDFLNRFEEYYIFERIDKQDELYAGFIMSLDSVDSDEMKERLAEGIEKGLNRIMQVTFRMMKNTIFRHINARAAMVFFYDPIEGFKKQDDG